MSKVTENKEKQGFKKESPSCKNCVNFIFDKIEVKKTWVNTVFIEEKNLRCGIGNFKVGKSNWCKFHEFK